MPPTRECRGRPALCRGLTSRHKCRDLATSASERPGLLLFLLVARRLRRHRTGKKGNWGTAPNPRSKAAALDNPADCETPKKGLLIRPRQGGPCTLSRHPPVEEALP